MRFKTLILPFFLAQSISGISQEVYPLHPSVGDTLDLEEKLDYSLFPKLENISFEFAVIQYRSAQFFLHANYQGKEIISALNQAEIIEAQQNIEKVNQYYRLKEKEAKNPKKENNYSSRPSGKAPLIMDKRTNELIRKEARMHLRLEEDARRMKDRQNGIQPNQLRIEFN